MFGRTAYCVALDLSFALCNAAKKAIRPRKAAKNNTFAYFAGYGHNQAAAGGRQHHNGVGGNNFNGGNGNGENGDGNQTPVRNPPGAFHNSAGSMAQHNLLGSIIHGIKRQSLGIFRRLSSGAMAGSRNMWRQTSTAWRLCHENMRKMLLLLNGVSGGYSVAANTPESIVNSSSRNCCSSSHCDIPLECLQQEQSRQLLRLHGCHVVDDAASQYKQQQQQQIISNIDLNNVVSKYLKLLLLPERTIEHGLPLHWLCITNNVLLICIAMLLIIVVMLCCSKNSSFNNNLRKIFKQLPQLISGSSNSLIKTIMKSCTAANKRQLARQTSTKTAAAAAKTTKHSSVSSTFAFSHNCYNSNYNFYANICLLHFHFVSR